MADDIRKWLDEQDLGKYADTFVDNGIDLDVVADLDEGDLEKLGLNMGDRKRLLRAIARLADGEPPTDGTEIGSEVASVQAAERRPLTVLFCDLVGSTALSRQLDPEDLREIMQQYQDAVAGAVTRYGGHVAKYLGDGVLAYFGWPQAFEDQAERAVLAGLDAVDAVNNLRARDERALEARVGIATGQVVVGDLVGESGRDAQAVTGETPNLAARLQGIADAGTVVIGENTRLLVEHRFTLENLGGHSLKGFDDAVVAWAVVGEAEAESRFEAAHTAALTRLVGRDAELDLLTNSWRLAQSGQGRVALVSGEAGIGKSRLVQGLIDWLSGSDHERIRMQCSPYHVNSAFYPVIQYLERTAGFLSEDSGTTKLDKLEAFCSQRDGESAEVVPLLANLLSLPYEDRYGVLEYSAQQIKQHQLQALMTYVVQLAETKPVLFLLEDAHWIDPTSLELLELVARHLDQARVFLVITHRPEWQAEFEPRDRITALRLHRLDKAVGADIVRTIAGPNVSDDAVARIVERTDGIPLFIEELTKSLIEGGLEISEADIPVTLQASLLARIDRLGTEAREIAQVGAVIGREFEYGLLAEVAARESGSLDAALTRLTRSELVFAEGEPPDATYTFKHALIQDAAYDSLLRTHRRSLHGNIADTLVRKFPLVAASQPEIVAQHYGLGEQPKQAAAYWSKAAQIASERSANVEALAHSKKGLAQLALVPESDERDLLELDLNLTLGPALMNLTSYSAPEVQQTYMRARELCERVGDPHQIFPMQFGLWVVQQMPGKYEIAAEVAHDLLDLAERQSDKGYLLQAHHANWTTLAAQSRLQQCFDHARKGVELYDPDQHHLHAYRFAGHDPGVCAWDHLAMMAWLLGYPDQAVENSREARQLANALQNPSSQVLSLVFSTWTHQYRQEPEQVLTFAAEAVEICEAHNFLPNAKAAAQILHGWARTMMATGDGNSAEVARRIEDWQETGSDLGRLSYFQAVHAEAVHAEGELDQALALVEEALANADGAGRERLLAAILGLKGDFLLKRGGEGVADAEQCLFEALEISRQIAARSPELRAATHLAGHWHRCGRTPEARELLAPIHAWFSEGFETRDLIEAKALLDEMA
jgi:class 3 adenylate cyclase/tetratricopeptide (TPR) repeat protein